LIEKYLLALKCLLASFKIEPSHPVVHEHIVRFKQAIDATPSTLSSKTAEAIQAEFDLIPSSISILSFNDEFLSNHKDSARHVIAALRVRKSLPSHDQAKLEKDLLAVLELSSITLEDAVDGLDLLASWNSSHSEAYRTKALSKWPEATIFAPRQ
jgi:peptide alpha-N-acetyltransferase